MKTYTGASGPIGRRLVLGRPISVRKKMHKDIFKLFEMWLIISIKYMVTHAVNQQWSQM